MLREGCGPGPGPRGMYTQEYRPDTILQNICMPRPRGLGGLTILQNVSRLAGDGDGDACVSHELELGVHANGFDQWGMGMARVGEHAQLQLEHAHARATAALCEPMHMLEQRGMFPSASCCAR